MKVSYKYKLLGSFLLLFILFTMSIVWLERSEEKKYKTAMLASNLNGYADMVDNYIRQQHLTDSTMMELGRIANLLPDEIRLSLIDNQGKVLYDRDVKDISVLGNHSNRPEIRSALFQNTGTDIRLSVSTHRPYLYFAKHYNGFFIRMALPYNITTKSLLKADNYFLYVLLIIFLVMLAFLYYVSNRFASSIEQLRNMAQVMKSDKKIPDDIRFENDEIGEVAQELATLFRQKNKAREELEQEKERMIKHFRYADEGIALFDELGNTVYANARFFSFANIITDKVSFDAKDFVESDALKPMKALLEYAQRETNEKSLKIERNGKIYFLHLFIYKDNGFEITIKDITQHEKSSVLKQQITGNVAHELKTPVACLRGFLETLHENSSKMDEEKKSLFIDKAYKQSIRLSELIDDISLLSKIEEADASYKFTEVDVNLLLKNVEVELSDRLQEHSVHLFLPKEELPDIQGNYSLLFSVFYNLLDNAIKYAGDGCDVYVKKVGEDKENLYLSFYDTGCGVDEKHFNRLFERFYRVNEGRTRNSGGSGLGLSIVKNVLILHHGEISVKRHQSGGLEFLIRLKK